MSKYAKLWEYVRERDEDCLALSFADIEKILGFAIDHSFLSFKKELFAFGYEVKKISMKKETVEIGKI